MVPDKEDVDDDEHSVEEMDDYVVQRAHRICDASKIMISQNETGRETIPAK